MSILFDGVYQNPTTPWWATDITNPANIEASTITINAEPAGNILLTNVISSGTEFNAPLIFQRPPLDPNAPSESLVMNLSDDVPTKPSNGSYITATKASGTAYDDIAVAGLQVYGNQTTSANSGAHAYITGDGGNLILAPKNSVNISSLQVSSLQVVNVVSTTSGVANSFTATLFMSTPILNTAAISSSQISTNTIRATTGNFSTVTVSTLNAPNFAISTVNTSTINSVFSDTKVSLTSTLSLVGNVNVDLGLGNQIAGLIGGAAGQALGVGIGGAGLITGAAALVTGRTSGGVNSNFFQTVNGSTQLQFSTIGANVSSVFLTVNSPNPLTTPGLEISTTQGVAAGTYCVRSVGDPLYINNNVSSIQMVGQWVPVIQPTATIPAVAISSLNVSSINGLPPGGGGGITSNVALSTATVSGNLSSIGVGTFSWGGNTISPTQVVLARPTAVNNTLTTTGAAFLNAGATVNSGLTVASGGANVTGNVTLSNSLFVLQILQGQTVQATGSLSVGGGGVSIVGGGISMASGNLNMTSGSSVANITNVNVGQNLVANQLVRANAISTNQISTNNINLVTINNQTYPPPSPPSQLPSTINASTINFDGGLNNVGSAPIITNTITTTNANVNFYNGNAITAASISTISISTNNINVNTINNAPYTPGGGGGGIPSTLNASTINVNGGQTVTNGGLTISNGGTVSVDGNNTWRYQMAGPATAISFVQALGNIESAILDLKNDKTTRFYSTLLVRDSTWPFPQPSGASIRTYDTNDPVPYGSVITSRISTLNINVSSVNGAIYPPSQPSTQIPSTLNASTINVNGGINIANGGIINNSFEPIRTGFLSTNFISTGVISANTLNTNSISTNTLNTNSISTNGIVASAGNIAQLAVSSINGLIYPIPTPPAAPTGSVTIWAGGSDNGAVQTFNVPAGWLLCDGAEYQRSVYSDLFNVIGTKYALNKPSTGLNFYVPDLTFAVPMGTPYRNYTSTIFSPSPFQIYVQSWVSDFAPIATPSAKTWKINQTVGGTLNYGTMFPASGIPLPGFPTLYVSQILSYDGYQGYIVVKSINGATIPDIPGGNQIIVQADGTAPQDNSGTYLYTLGSYGVTSGYPQVTRNQKAAEVASHTHTFRNTAFFGSTGLANGPDEPGKGVDPNAQTGSNQLSTISTVGATNIGTYTAPNFINMLYIIKV